MNGIIRGMPATSVIYKYLIELTKKKDTQDYFIYVISVIFKVEIDDCSLFAFIYGTVEIACYF